MLASEGGEHGRLMFAKREARITETEGSGSRWSLDHLYLDRQGVPTLVEVLLLALREQSSDAAVAAEAILGWPPLTRS